jgi:hypothetical protein
MIVVVQAHEHPAIGSQIDKIRDEIRQSGECYVGKDELFLLCPGEVSNAQELIGISEIAEWEHWTFKYLPSGSVRFSSL